MTETDSAQGEAAVLPDLQLASPDGQLGRLSDYRGDRSLVALFSGGAECGPCRHALLTDLCGRPEEYAAAGATALLVLRCSSLEAELVRRREGLNVPVLIDPAGEACRLVGAESPDGNAATAVVVTDCGGRIYLQNRPEQNGLPPTRDAILSCLRGIGERSCAGGER
jgi:mycoredoxin-dependent peroxiredoxin